MFLNNLQCFSVSNSSVHVKLYCFIYTVKCICAISFGIIIIGQNW